ncbi:chaperonin 10-like protein [Lophiotrema nucula]|uniref:D-xylulose reductase n=1 Tax=Lophiotrema nucula TaxID=690887 RepID=A0A6A5ZLU1_9PLEO|nr:chaperonin 10-like protein [Lophiotrema nucula]
MQNPSAVLYSPGTVKIEDRPIPTIQDPHDVLVRIAFVGVCGSDVHFWKHGGINGKVPPPTGLIMGHEASGTIHEIGGEVTSVKVGERVAIEPGIPCRRCKVCKDGKYNLCKGMQFAAAPGELPGTLARFFRVPEDFVYRVPESVSLEEAVFVEPMSVAVHAVKMVDIRPGETVVVMGSGTIGLLCAAVAKQFGAHRVMLVDILDSKLEFARKYLGCETFKPGMVSAEENAEGLLKQLGVDGVDTVIEASGAAPSIETGIYILRPGGKYVQTGLGRPKIEFPIVTLSEKELLVRGCFRYGSGDYELATSLLTRGIIDVKPLISSITSFGDTSQAWDKTMRGEGIKNLIRGVQD